MGFVQLEFAWLDFVQPGGVQLELGHIQEGCWCNFWKDTGDDNL